MDLSRLSELTKLRLVDDEGISLKTLSLLIEHSDRRTSKRIDIKTKKVKVKFLNN